ncbi:Clavaminate synthase-like protein [Lentinula aciculospora]|uniref:Clavaminate synthase-like protein n=1 Tax=Lentinula aciculospora TaxID=153920 RepID=A0A9W9AH68_9AGAR|nr:Clavaminate synthase-like protein [Lentinula aciculospora]
MAITLTPLPIPSTADPSNFAVFGQEVLGVNPGKCSADELKEIKDALYRHEILLFRNVSLTPEQQYALTKFFDPTSNNFGHGNNKIDSTKSSVLHPDLKTIPRVPQVQLIGNGPVYNHEGIPEAKLKHPMHMSCHKTVIKEDEVANAGLSPTRFYRWHIDAALYDLSPSRVTTLHAIRVPQGLKQVVRYDDETGDELLVPLGTTAFVSGQRIFGLLTDELKSVAVRAKVKYAPHPYIWMARSHVRSTGLGLESEGLEKSLEELPPWSDDKVKIYPMLWKNPVTNKLSLQVHPGGASEIIIDPLPNGADRAKTQLYPGGAHIKDLQEVRELLYRMQRPGIAPKLVYPHDWHENDLIIFHNRGVLHSVVGTFLPDQVRVFHQCNLAASNEPVGPNVEDVEKWA